MKRTYLLMLMAFFIVVLRGQTSIATLSLGSITDRYTQQNMYLHCDTTIILNHQSAITGLSVSGVATLQHESNSLVRITLQDNYNTEYLVYELFPLLADSNIVEFDNFAFESAVLDYVNAKQLNVTLINSTLQLEEINISTNAVRNYAANQTSTLASQSTYIIDKLNENLEKNNMTWRAGETSISQLTYEEKKTMFGGEVPNLGGLEYYIGGVFVMPGFSYSQTKQTSALLSVDTITYVSEWDWRNRHGKNWVTSVKDQGQCGSCWVFSALGVIESYVNLYYNQQLNLDLSEQEIVSCYGIDGCEGGNPNSALLRSKYNGVIDEESFPYVGENGDCNNKLVPSKELIKIDGHQLFFRSFYPENKLKEILYRAPVTFHVPSWKHFLVLVGYKTLQIGDEISVDKIMGGKTIIEEGDSLIGATVWILKNSWGGSYGENGYIYLVTDWENISDSYYIIGEITSLSYDCSDIVIEDKDNDGYYFWGIGERPESIPSWAQEKADGDDSNPLYGALDAFGNLENISLASYPDIVINTDTVWDEDNYVYNNVRIVSGGRLIVSADVMKYFASSIIVESGGELIINGGTISRGNVVVKNNGKMSILGNGEIRLDNSNNFKVEKGGVFDQSFGKVKIID